MSLAAVAALVAVATLGCRSAAPAVTPQDLEMAIETLMRPLPGDPAALYRVRVSSSGGLRIAMLTSGDAGRMTVSEPFGSAVSLTAWTGSGPPTFYDLREGCWLEASSLERALGVAAMPLPRAVRLLGGRLPAHADDRLTGHDDGRIGIEGFGWSALVTVGAAPWRVLEVEEGGSRKGRWRIVLRDHTLSVPGSLRLENADGRWAELELVRLEWNDGVVLPALPDVPPCLPEPGR